MNLLLEPAPADVEISGKTYRLDADYRNAIKFEELMLDPEVPDEARGMLALRLFYPVIPDDVSAAFEKIVWFYAGGEDPQQRRRGSAGASAGKRVYSYEHDSAYIYAAFLADYGIDLESIDFLHWWKFRALFESLREDNLICRIMGYRSADLSKLKGEQRKHYQEMQRFYALPRPRDEQEKLDKINDILLNGGDIASAL